ncbi:MAG: PAN domain-containing protein [Pseudomonadota bacterium]
MALAAPAAADDWIERLCPDPDGKIAAGVPYTDSREAQEIIALITRQAPMFAPIRAITVDRSLLDVNAFAYNCRSGAKIVVFNSRFLDRVRRSRKGTAPYWSWIFIAAHEVGHLWRNHGLLQMPCPADRIENGYCPCGPGEPDAYKQFNISLELEADYFAGYVLARLGADRDEALSAMHALESAACTHPDVQSRKISVNRGFNQSRDGVRATYAQGSKEDLAQFITADNFDVYGGDYNSIYGISIEACARQCLRKAGNRCILFSFDRWNNACFLKSRDKIWRRFSLAGRSGTRPLTRSDAILKREVKSTIGVRKDLAAELPGVDPRGRSVRVRIPNRHFYDQSYRQTTADAWSGCADVCDRDSQACVAWSFRDGRCELFSKTDGHYPAEGRSIGYRWVQNK